MTRLILHLGDHKTGTSTLQQLFAAGHGPAHVLYPSAGRANGTGHHNLAWEIGADPRFNPAKGRWSDAWQQIAEHAPEVALISTEAFEFKRPKRAVSAIMANRPDFVSAVDGIVYIRPHASRLLSSFAERIKRGIGPFDRQEFLGMALNGKRYQFASRIRRWRKMLAPGHLAVRVFQRSHLLDGDIVTDFFKDVLGAEPPKETAAKVNESPGAIGLQLMQMHGAALLVAGGPRLARAQAHTIRAAARPCGDGPKPNWSGPEAEQIRRACAGDARALDDLLGVDVFSTALDRTVDEAKNCDTPSAELRVQSAIADARSTPAGVQFLQIPP